MATMHADYQDRERIVFTSRGRSFVNVRTKLDDGPIGYSSTELLLLALGNCTLGALLNQPLLTDVGVAHAEATLDAEMVPNPRAGASLIARAHLRRAAAAPQLRGHGRGC